MVDNTEHELHEWGRMACIVRQLQYAVILLLLRFDKRLDWHVFEYRIMPAQQNGMPQASHTSVAVQKRMDILEFVMKDTAFNQHQIRIGFQIMQQVVQLCSDSFSRWCQVGKLFTFDDTHRTSTQLAGMVYQSVHQQSVGLADRFNAVGFELCQTVIGRYGVLYL